MNTRRFALILSSFLIAAMWGSSAALATQTMPSSDLLVYSVGVENGEHTTHLYDPATEQQTAILSDYRATSLKFSIDGRLAFAHYHDGNSELYVTNLSQGDAPINLSDVLSLRDYAYPLGWSFDGRSLAFTERKNDEVRVHVWDGDSTVDITPEGITKDVTWYRAVWSQDGRIAITAEYAYGYEADRSEIFVWDSNTTFNLSKNPGKRDSGAVWSGDGRLAFISEQGDWNSLYIWDPRKDTAPTYVPLSANPNVTSFDLAWTNDERLAFSALGISDSEYQVYVWDGENDIDFSQIPTHTNINPRWAEDGRWAFVNIWSDRQMIYVRDAANQTLLATDGDFAPAWSPNGLLAFCALEESEWVLHLWNGAEVSTVARGDYIEAQWQGGAGINCTSG